MTRMYYSIRGDLRGSNCCWHNKQQGVEPRVRSRAAGSAPITRAPDAGAGAGAGADAAAAPPGRVAMRVRPPAPAAAGGCGLPLRRVPLRGLRGASLRQPRRRVHVAIPGQVKVPAGSP